MIAISWSAIFVRWADIPGSASAFYRVLIAACIFVPWRAAYRPAGARRQAPDSRALLVAVAAGIFFALDLALFNTAVMRSSASTTTLLGSNAPVFVGLGSWLLLGHRPHRLFWAGLAASTIGMALMIGAGLDTWTTGVGDARSALDATRSAIPAGAFTSASATVDAVTTASPHDVVGDLMAVAAALCFAGYILAVAEARARLDTLTLNTVAMISCTLTLLPICLAIDAPLWGYTASTWMALLYLGAISQVAAYLGVAYALGHLPATVVSIGLLAQAPLTALFASFLLDERLAPLQLAGGALVLTGILIVTRAGRGSGAPPPPASRP